MSPVPHCDVKVDARKESTLGQPERHTANQESLVTGNQAHKGHRDTPSKHNDGEPQ